MRNPTDEYFVIQLLVRACLIKRLAVNTEDNTACFRISDSSEYVVLKAFVVFSSLILGLKETASHILHSP